MSQLQSISIQNYTTLSGKLYKKIPLSYQVFGQAIGTAPVVLVNHALTGNSDVAGENGWWKSIVGYGKVIDLDKFTVLAFNIPGNGFDDFLIENYKDFIARDVATIFIQGLVQLNITELYAIIGGSLGGGIGWEMISSELCSSELKKIEKLISIATDWKSTDWMVANCLIQEQILQNSNNPIHDARLHAMLCYRTPASFKQRFGRTKNEELGIFNVESWLLHHGKKLQDRFQLSAYKLMTQLLKTIDITKGRDESVFDKLSTEIHLVGIDSDLFFTAAENKETYQLLSQKNKNVSYHEIQSIHGHDAFLIEYPQLEKILNPIFNSN